MMCEQTASNMPASRELDLRIAREVFGLTRPPTDRNERGGLFGWEQRGDGTWYGEDHWPEARSWVELEWPPEYSTFIVSAWEIVELFRHGWNGHAAAFVRIDMYDTLDPSDCYVGIVAPNIPQAAGWAGTVPLAICRAALEAVERCSGT